MHVGEMARAAAEFQLAMNAAKARIAPTHFQWYPYDSLGNLFNLDATLTGSRRQVLDLIGPDPVLDIGCGDGDLAFFLESLGCRVHAIDKAATNYNRMSGVRAMKAELGSGVAIIDADLDLPIPFPPDRYGAAFLLGVLYHLKNPFLILESLARHARYCFLSTRIAESTPDGLIQFSNAPLAYLLAPGEFNNDETNYWIFSSVSLRRLLDRSGWEVLDYRIFGSAENTSEHTSEHTPDRARDLRIFCCARSRVFEQLSKARLLAGWHALEESGWRWTERRFSVEFPKVPDSAVLSLRFVIPDERIAKLGPLTMRAAANGKNLPVQQYAGAGRHEFRCDLPDPGNITVEFEVDQAFQAPPPDDRELGVLVLALEVEPPAPTGS